MELVYSMTNQNQFWVYSLDNYPAMLNHLQNVGEEMSDALHFFVELLIYANIQPEHIVKWCKNHNPDSLFQDKEALAYIARTGINLIQNTPDVSNVHILKYYSGNTDELPYFRIGSRYYSSYLDDMSVNAWKVTYLLNISRNFLKNKAWKNSEVMTQESAYQYKLVEAFVVFIGLFTQMGANPEDIYFLYFKKNLVNQFRIKSNY